MKPGTRDENNPWQHLPDEIPHMAPHFQEVPFHIRWPGAHPASQPLLMWLEEAGHLMSEEEEQILDKRSKAGARKLSLASAKGPRMVSADKVEEELLSAAGVDEALLDAALNDDEVEDNDEEDAGDDVIEDDDADDDAAADQVATGGDDLNDDESLINAALELDL